MITRIVGLKRASQKACHVPAGRTYAKCLDIIQAAIMQQRIAPVSVPILEKDTIQLVIHPRVRRAEYDSHVIRCRVVDPECVNVPGFDRGLPIFVGQFSDHAVNFHGAYPVLDREVFRLELMEVHRWTFWSARAIDELPKILGDRTFDITSIGLSETEASPWKWWKKLGGQ